MTRLYVLDTNMVSYIVKGRSAAARARLLDLQDEEVAAVSAVTEAEVCFGLELRPEATALRALMKGFLAGIRVLAWGSAEAEAYGRVRADLRKKGLALGGMDLMIAAQAIAIGATLVTNDQAFAQVEELSSIENWATDL